MRGINYIVLKTTYLHLDLIFYMKKFTIMLLSVISVISVVGSVQIVAADHLEPGIGIFKNDGNANIVESHDSKWQIYLQIMVRNEDGQLISVTKNNQNIHGMQFNTAKNINQ